MKINTSSFFLLCFLSFILLVLTYSNHLDAAKSGNFGIETAQQAAKTAKSPGDFLNLRLEDYNSGQYEKSVKAVEEARKLRPDYDLAYNNISAAYNELGQWNKAREACLMAINLNPRNQLAKNNLDWADKFLLPQKGLWDRFWEVDYWKPHTPNFIDPPLIGKMSFLTLLYLGVILLTVCFLLFRPLTKDNAVKSFLLASIISGILFAARMDYNWFMWMKKDAGLLPLAPADRVTNFEYDSVYEFAAVLKKLIPPGERVKLFCGEDLDGRMNSGHYSKEKIYNPKNENFQRLKIKYHLLPVEITDDSDYVAVFKDNRIFFDPSKKTLIKNGVVVASNVSLLKSFGDNRFIYKIDGSRSTP